MSHARQAMLERIRQARDASRESLRRQAHLALDAPSFPAHVLLPEEDRVAQFSRELSKLTGVVHRCADQKEAASALRSLLRQYGATSIIAWDADQIGLPGLESLLAAEGVSVLPACIRGDDRAARLQDLEPVQVCLSGVDAAIAESGSLLVVSGVGRGRLASLLAPVHIAVLPASCIRPGLAGALDLVRERFGDQVLRHQSNLAIISGPSRTADIELSLTFGVHGPREIHVLIMLDS